MKFFNDKIDARFTELTMKKIEYHMRRNPTLWKNKSDFVRSAVINFTNKLDNEERGIK